MNEYGLSEDTEAAKEHMRKLIETIWKKMNKERVENSLFANSLVDAAFNLARVSPCHYQYGDRHSAPNELSRKQVSSVIIEPISLETKQKEVFS